MYIFDKLRLFEDFGQLFLRLCKNIGLEGNRKGFVLFQVLNDSQIVVVLLYILLDLEDSKSERDGYFCL